MKASNDAAHSDFPLSISTMESLTFHIHLRGWKESTSFYVAGNYEARNDAAYSDFPLSISTVESLTFHIHRRGWKESTSFYVAGNYESQQRRSLQRLSTLAFHSGKPHFPHSLLRVESERLFRRVWKLLKPATAGPPATFHPRETCHFHFPPTMKIRGSCRINLLRVDGVRGVWVSVSRSGCWRCQGRIGQFGIAALSPGRARGCRYAAMMAVWALAKWGIPRSQRDAARRVLATILPNGRFFAQALRASAVQEIFEVTDAGLIGGGVSFRWGDIVGFV